MKPLAPSITPALVSSSLYLPISVSSCSFGSTPASEFFVALTITMNLIVVVSFFVRFLNGLGFACECKCCCRRDQKSSPCGRSAWPSAQCGISHRAASNARRRRRNPPLRAQRCTRTGFETWRATEGQHVRTKFIFGPLAVLRVSHGRWLEVQDVFVEFTSAFHVGDRVTAKC